MAFSLHYASSVGLCIPPRRVDVSEGEWVLGRFGLSRKPGGTSVFWPDSMFSQTRRLGALLTVGNKTKSVSLVMKPVVVYTSVDGLSVNRLYLFLSELQLVCRGYPATSLLVNCEDCLACQRDQGLFPPAECLSRTMNCLWTACGVFFCELLLEWLFCLSACVHLSVLVMLSVCLCIWRPSGIKGNSK